MEFLANISKVLAEVRVPIFVISAYSTDHIFVRDRDLVKAKEKLESLGCTVEKGKAMMVMWNEI